MKIRTDLFYEILFIQSNTATRTYQVKTPPEGLKRGAYSPMGLKQVRNITPAMGRSRGVVDCDCCFNEFTAYPWSFAGSGKHCPHCGVHVSPHGSKIPWEKLTKEQHQYLAERYGISFNADPLFPITVFRLTGEKEGLYKIEATAGTSHLSGEYIAEVGPKYVTFKQHGHLTSRNKYIEDVKGTEYTFNFIPPWL